MLRGRGAHSHWLLGLASLWGAQALAADIATSDPGVVLEVTDRRMPVIHIAKPDKHGLSHNTFTRLNVDSDGVIFNNSNVADRSLLGGEVNANPNFDATMHARHILAEVTGRSGVSHLEGPLEILGPKADLIIANPDGIYASGVATLNTRSLTLSTGAYQPGASGGKLVVTQGDVTIGSEGLFTSGLAAFDVVAYAINVQGLIGPGTGMGKARSDLSFVAGAGELDLASGALTVNTSPAEAGTPPAAIHGGVLGSMYGDAIKMVVAGDGVKLQGGVYSHKDVQILANGDIQMGKVQAGGDLILEAEKAIVLTEFHPPVSFSTVQTLRAKAGQELTIGQHMLAMSADVQAHSLRLQPQSGLTVQGEQLIDGLGARLRLHDGLFVEANEQSQGKLRVYQGGLGIESKQLVNEGRIETLGGALAIVTGKFDNRGEISAGTQADLVLDQYRNTGQIAAVDVKLLSRQPLLLEETAKAPLVLGNMSLLAPEVTIKQALGAPGTLLLEAREAGVINHGALLAGGSLVVLAKEQLTNSDGAMLWSGGVAQFSAGHRLHNQPNALIHAEGDMDLSALQAVRNLAGRIQAGGKMRIETPILLNHSLLSGGVSVEHDQSAEVPIFKYAQPHYGRWVHLEVQGVRPGKVMSTLAVDQGVIHADGNVEINQQHYRGKQNLLVNQGRMTAGGQTLINADVQNLSLSKALSISEHLQAEDKINTTVWDNFASFGAEGRSFDSLESFLDHALGGADKWTRLWGAYYYKHSWLSNSLANHPIGQNDEIGRVLASVLGADWKGLSEAARVQRWQDFKRRGWQNTHVRYYPEQRTMLSAKDGVLINGRVINGEQLWFSPEQSGLAPFRQVRVDQTLQQSLRDILANQYQFWHHPDAEASQPYFQSVLREQAQRDIGNQHRQAWLQTLTDQPVPLMAGDANFDTKLVARQLDRLLDGQLPLQLKQEELALQRLQEQASAVKDDLQLKLGQKLSAEQIDRLDRDIVWYTLEEIQGQQRLLPSVYLGNSSRQQAERARRGGGAAIVSAGSVDIQPDADKRSKIEFHNAMLIGRQVRLDNGDGEVRIISDDGVEGGVLGEQALLIEGGSVLIRGGLLAGSDIFIKGDDGIDVMTGMRQNADGSTHRDEGTGIVADEDLTLQSNGRVTTHGATLGGRNVSIEAGGVLLNDVREKSSKLRQQIDFNLLFYSEQTDSQSRDRGAGTTITAERFALKVARDMSIVGGRITARNTQASIGGNLNALSSTTHDSAWQRRRVFDLWGSARVGAGGQEAGVSGGIISDGKATTSHSNFAGAEVQSGLHLEETFIEEDSTTNQNSQLDLGDGFVDVEDSLDIGGGDLNPSRSEGDGDGDGRLEVEAGDIQSTKPVDTLTRNQESWVLFIGNRSTAGSSLLNVSSTFGTTIEQAGDGAQVDPILLSGQALGAATRVLLDDTGYLATGFGGEFSFEEFERKLRAETTQTLGGNVSLRTTKGDLTLIGARLSGGQLVELDSKGKLWVTSAQKLDQQSGSSRQASVFSSITGSCNVYLGSCGVGGNVTTQGAASDSKREENVNLHSRISAETVHISAQGDLRLLGASVVAGRLIELEINGDVEIVSVQDALDQSAIGGDWQLGGGIALNTRTYITPTGTIGGAIRHDSAHSSVVGEGAGLNSDGTINANVQGNLKLVGGIIQARLPGSSVHVHGKTELEDVEDVEESGGQHFGGGVGISASSGVASGSIDVGRGPGKTKKEKHHPTIDVGQDEDDSSFTSDGGISGSLNEDAGQATTVEENLQWAQQDISLMIGKLEPGRGKRLKLEDGPDLSGENYGRRTIVVLGDDVGAVIAAHRLADKHPGVTEVLQSLPGEGLKRLRGSAVDAGGTQKVQFIGHGGADPDHASVGGHDASQLANLLQQVGGSGLSKVVIVACNVGACSDGGISAQLRRQLPADSAVSISGYEGRVDVTPDGRKVLVEEGGLGPKRDPARPAQPGSSEEGGADRSAQGSNRPRGGAEGGAGAATPARRPAFPIQTVEQSLRRVDDIRRRMAIESRRNIALAYFDIDGQKGELVGVSGFAARRGTVGMPQKPRFQTIATGQNSRQADSEVKILEHLATKLSPHSSGTLHLFSERPLCISCSNVVPQFQAKFPSIRIEVTDGSRR